VEFRWNEWNIDHIAEHGVEPDEAELVVRTARRPYPKYHADDKWLVWGRGRGGRLLQVIFVLDEDDTKYVIHARPLTPAEKRRWKKRS
jgi:uncharacterized DUF497 family protein